MKKVLLLSAAVLALSAPVANAQGINLHWNDCSLGGGVGNLNDACTATFGAPYLMVASVNPPLVPNFVGAELVLDLQVDAPSLPDWWRYDAAGCRAGRITATFDFAVTGPFNCPEPWAGQAFGGVDYSLKANPAQARIKVAAAIANGVVLDPGVAPDWYLAKISLLKTASTSCAGCLTPACIVFNSVLLAQPAGQGNFFISNPAVSQHVTWQGGGALATACPGVTPNQTNSWGEIKAMYR